MGENGTWAVKCYGWIKLSDEQYRFPYGYRSPLPTRWGIIKDYLPDPVQLSDVPEIVRKKEIARRAKTCPYDIQPRNCRGSFVVDLGNMPTAPDVKRLWSSRNFEQYHEMYDKWVSAWEVDEESGEVVPGGINA